MASLRKLSGEKEVTLEGMVGITDKVDYGRLVETATIVRGILKEEKARDSGLMMKWNMAYIPKVGNAIVIGDLHGDESSFIKILKETNFVERLKKGERLSLVFLGDYIDRGPHSVEVVNLMLELKRNFRDNVIMLRGDHEVLPSSPNSPGGTCFFNECVKKYGHSGFDAHRQYLEIFGMLPLAAKSSNGILFVHGGVDDRTNEASIAYGGEEIETALLWNDFRKNVVGVKHNTDRGIGKFFGPDIVEKVRVGMGVNVIINAHESLERGDVERCDGKLLTINSNGIIGPLSRKKFAVGYAEVSLEEEVNNVKGLFHEI